MLQSLRDSSLNGRNALPPTKPKLVKMSTRLSTKRLLLTVPEQRNQETRSQIEPLSNLVLKEFSRTLRVRLGSDTSESAINRERLMLTNVSRKSQPNCNDEHLIIPKNLESKHFSWEHISLCR